MPTLPNRLRQAAQYVWQGELYDLLIEAAGALEGAEPVAWLESEPSTKDWPARDLFFGLRAFAYSSRMHFGEKPIVMDNRLTPLYTATQPPERKPLKPDVSQVEGINARIHFRRGWHAAEAAHGIKE